MEIFSVNSVGTTGWLYRKINLDLFFISYPLICLSWIINLNVKTKITRLLEKKYEGFLTFHQTKTSSNPESIRPKKNILIKQTSSQLKILLLINSYC